MSSRRLVVSLLAAVLVVSIGLVGTEILGGGQHEAVVVEPGEQVSEAAATGRPVLLAPGRHRGFVLDDATTVRGLPGAVITGAVVVRADGTRLEDLHVVGGESGISVDGARNVLIDGVAVEGSMWHGIEVVAGTATVRDCRVSGLVSPLAQGVEIRNSNGLGRSTVEGCVVDGGQEGIVSHVSRVEFRDNDVSGTTMRGIVITEMSEGVIEGNAVHSAMGTGLFCGDMSHCEVRNNNVWDVEPDPGGIRSRGGQSLVTWYYSTLRSTGNDFSSVDRVGDAIGVYHGSVTTDRFPLSHWPAGWQGAIPGLWATAIAGAVLVLVRVLLAPLFAQLRSRWSTRRSMPEVARLGMWAFLVTGIIQLFHFLEHGVQVHQVYVADAAVRTGVVGARFDTEWLHLGFNVTVLVGTLVGIALSRAELAGRFSRVVPWLLAGVAVQTWHVAEHVARVMQYLETGISPAPGLVGADFGLVWFHYAINVPITVALTLIGCAWLGRAWRRRPSPSGFGGLSPAAAPPA